MFLDGSLPRLLSTHCGRSGDLQNARMAVLARSVWFPMIIGTLLFAASFVVGASFLNDLLFSYGILVLLDSKAWMDAALTATYFYEGEEPEVDWWKITREAYDPPSFYMRFVASAGLSAFFGLAMRLDSPIIWVGCFVALVAYGITLFFLFRRHIMTYMRNIGIPLKRYAVAEEARFDTRNPEDR